MSSAIPRESKVLRYEELANLRSQLGSLLGFYLASLSCICSTNDGRIAAALLNIKYELALATLYSRPCIALPDFLGWLGAPRSRAPAKG